VHATRVHASTHASVPDIPQTVTHVCGISACLIFGLAFSQRSVKRQTVQNNQPLQLSNNVDTRLKMERKRAVSPTRDPIVRYRAFTARSNLEPYRAKHVPFLNHRVSP
jgi:hypothetical protein